MKRPSPSRHISPASGRLTQKAKSLLFHFAAFCSSSYYEQTYVAPWLGLFHFRPTEKKSTARPSNRFTLHQHHFWEQRLKIAFDR